MGIRVEYPRIVGESPTASSVSEAMITSGLMSFTLEVNASNFAPLRPCRFHVSRDRTVGASPCFAAELAFVVVLPLAQLFPGVQAVEHLSPKACPTRFAPEWGPACTRPGLQASVPVPTTFSASEDILVALLLPADPVPDVPGVLVVVFGADCGGGRPGSHPPCFPYAWLFAMRQSHGGRPPAFHASCRPLLGS